MGKEMIIKKVKEIKELLSSNTLGTPCEVYTRVTGYYRPINLFCNGKASEFADRLPYQI